MITLIAAPDSNTTKGLARPVNPATGAGRPKMPLPTMLLTASATMLQRPIARTNSGCALCDAGLIALLYHNGRGARWLRPPTQLGGVSLALQLRDAPRMQCPRRAARYRQASGALGCRQAPTRALRPRNAQARPRARSDRSAPGGNVALARAAAAPPLCRPRESR